MYTADQQQILKISSIGYGPRIIFWNTQRMDLKTVPKIIYFWTLFKVRR